MRFISCLRQLANSVPLLTEAMVRAGNESTVRVTRNYEDTVRALNSLQTNAAVLEQIRKERGNREMRNSIPQMENFLKRINIEVNELDKLNVIHVSGTKGKGSTCAFSESILRHCGLKTGFYSSPHLIEVRERMRINGKPLDKDKFVKYFWQVMDKLEATLIENDGEMPAYFRFLTLLSYHVFLQEQECMLFEFKSDGITMKIEKTIQPHDCWVDVAVVEVGIGGAHDCTNVIRNPVVCGIAMLGVEHTSSLGDTIQKIAWHKAGIMKTGHPAVTIPQADEVYPVFKETQHELKADLFMAPYLQTYENDLPVIGLEGTHQQYNASLALQLCRIWLSEKENFLTSNGLSHLAGLIEPRDETKIDDKSGLPVAPPFFIPQPFMEGIRRVKWPGRNQVVERKKVTFYLDGAHTTESVRACSDWFSARKDLDIDFPREDVFRVLVFNSTGARDAHTLLRPISAIDFDFAVFCPNVLESNNNQGSSDQTNFTVTKNQQIWWCTQNQLAWLALRGTGIDSTASAIDTTSSHLSGLSLQMSESSAVFPNISDAVRWIVCGKDPLIEKPREGGPDIPGKLAMAEQIQVLVVGSLHLIGGVMKFLGPEIVELV